MRHRLSLILLVLAGSSLALPAAASPASSAPKITQVQAMRTELGSKLTIRGEGFSSRRLHNTLIFRAPSGQTAFAKPARASAGKLVVRVPYSLASLMSRRDGQSVPTRFKLRVLSGRLGAYTPKRLSPVVVPPGAASPLGG